MILISHQTPSLSAMTATTPTEKDVNRTDRNHPFFEGEHNPNVTLLHDILMTFVMYNFDLGYVQGMSDLLAPILYVTQDEATAFWCFVGYMDMVVSEDDGKGTMGGNACRKKLMWRLVERIKKIVKIWLRAYEDAKDS